MHIDTSYTIHTDTLYHTLIHYMHTRVTHHTVKMSHYKRTVVVTGLGADVEKADISQLFSDFGEVSSFLSKSELGTAFVILKDSATAAVAVKKSGSKIKDKAVSVSLASSRHESELASFLGEVSYGVEDVESLMRRLEKTDLDSLLSKFVKSVDSTTGSTASSAQSVASGGISTQPGSVRSAQHDLMDRIPRIQNFSGDSSKGDLSYSQWKYEVKCLLADGFSERAVSIAVRHSVRGTAAEVLRSLGEDPKLDRVLSRFEDCFKTYLSKDQLFPLFYAAQQGPKESVAVWGCRLVDILSQILEQGGVTEEASKDMLRTKFWFGLRDSRVREATRYQLDSGLDYEALFRAVRVVEQEFESSKTALSHQSSLQSDSVVSKELKELTSEVKAVRSDLSSFGDRLTRLENAGSSTCHNDVKPDARYSPKNSPRKKGKKSVCSRCGRLGHLKGKCVARFHVKGHRLNDQTPSSGGETKGVNKDQ